MPLSKMIITLSYKPGKSISIDNKLLLWNTDRQSVRQMLDEPFEIADSVIDLSKYHNGDISLNITKRRDIYKNYKEQDNLFFLNYDKEDRLRDIEIHHGLEISVNGETLSFSMNIEEVIELLQNMPGKEIQLSDGEYFFENLKLTIASGQTVGGDGNKLSYFYCSRDVSHLTNN